MRRTIIVLTLAAALASAGALASCAARASISTDWSPAFEPPASWEAGIHFSIGDSLRYPDAPYGLRAEVEVRPGDTLVVTARDLFDAPNGSVRTPWYRIPLAGERRRVVTIRVLVGDSTGQESVAHYDLTVERDDFYRIITGVATNEPPPPHRPSLLHGVQLFPVHAGAQRRPSDSLFVGYTVRGRACFNCFF